MANLNILVQDGNNINVEVTPTARQTISIDRGVAGVGIENVEIVFIDSIYYLEFTYTDGTTELVQLPAIASGVVSFNTRIGVVTLNSTDVTTALDSGSITNIKLQNSFITINGTSTSLGGSINVGTVTSVAATAGTGIAVTGSPITTSGTLNITNTAPDQVVSLTGAGTTSISGTYPNFTVTSDDQFDGTVTSVAASAGTGISVSGSPITSSGTITITNTAPDQVVSLTGAGTTSISGTYPNFTVTSNDAFTGNVTGAASSTDNAVVRFDGTTGKAIQNSSVIIDDSNNVSGVATLNVANLIIADNTTLGGSNADTVAVNGRITTDLEPNTTGSHDIGTNGRNWRDGFFSRNLTTTTLNATDVNASSAIISANSSTNALRITQTGTGNAMLVEDSANPDATPFVIDANGKTIIGSTSAITTANFNSPLQIMEVGSGASQGGATLSRWATTANSPKLSIAHSGGASIGDYTIVRNNDGVGKVDFLGSDGAAFITAAQVEAFVDGTPGTNDMPGRLVFSTTADGASSPTERMRINSLGNVGIGATPNASALLDVQSTTKGVRMPNMTTTQKNAIASPAAGLMVFDTTLSKLCIYTGAAWQTITSV